MKLKNLTSKLEIVETIGNLDCEIKDVKTDSNSVSAGSLFVCLKGDTADGHDFIRQVEGYGAVAFVCERKLDTALPQIIVRNSRKALAVLASAIYGDPSKGLRIIGVLGTNGKTTTAKLICDVINYGGVNCGFVGTLGTYYNGVMREQNLTTPDPLELHKAFLDMKENGVKAVVMEVSAHAVYYDKVYGISFEGAVFTNFTQDHLDFFSDMTSYEKAKLKFFKEYSFKYVVTNVDDPVGRKITDVIPVAITYGIENPSDVFAIDVVSSTSGESFILNLFDCIYDVKLQLLGLFNVYNALASATAASLFGIQTKKVKEGLEKAGPIEGRLERVFDKEWTVVVDYAHTPDGLEKAILALRPLCFGRLVCIFGCGGNRDKQKRQVMGQVAGKNADFTIVTTDNPRFEEPMDIISEVEKGVLKETTSYVLIQDREEAIKYAMQKAKKGDVILIAGKGAERYQETLGIKKLYNDKDTVINVLRGK